MSQNTITLELNLEEAQDILHALQLWLRTNGRQHPRYATIEENTYRLTNIVIPALVEGTLCDDCKKEATEEEKPVPYKGDIGPGW